MNKLRSFSVLVGVIVTQMRQQIRSVVMLHSYSLVALCVDRLIFQLLFWNVLFISFYSGGFRGGKGGANASPFGG